MITNEHFDATSWHDNPIHAFRIVEGVNGGGDLILDIDHIVEWVLHDDGYYGFTLVASDLTFHDVTDLVISIDFPSCSAGLVPPSIHDIQRETIKCPNDSTGYKWGIDINWPRNSFIKFQASGFTQTARSEPIAGQSQALPVAMRNVFGAPPRA